MANDLLTPAPSGAPRGRSRSSRWSAVAVLAVSSLGLLGAACAKKDDAADTADGKGIKVVLTDDGCEPTPATAASGEVSFAITNDGSAKVTEAELKSGDLKNILGEKESLTPGLNGTFKLKLAEGTYKMVCPGAKQDTWDFTVSKGEVVKDWKSNPQLVAAVQGYSDYVDEQTAELVTVTNTFVAAVKAGDIAKAKSTYAQARVPYERIEPVAESFGDLDPAIDGRADDVEAKDLTGFHRIEYALWVDNSLEGMDPIADKLVADIAKLQTLVKQKSGTYIPNEVTNGAKELMDEVMVGKITGEEERYSHTDLLDFQANLDGSLKAIDLVRPVLQGSAPDLLKKIDAQAAVVQKALDVYKQTPGYQDTGFAEWGWEDDKDTKITTAQRRTFANAVKPLTELLGEVPVKVTV